MNIFKILANGDGSINEPNVSSFLAYLLEPRAEHGLGDELLRRVLSQLIENNDCERDLKESVFNFLLIEDELRDLSLNSNFEFEILLEQAFRADSEKKSTKKEIVDIVILCFERTRNSKENIAKLILSDESPRELKHIFLLENKIKDSSNSSKDDRNQLFEQYKASVDELKAILPDNKDIEQMISMLFVCPNMAKSNQHYEEFLTKTNRQVSCSQLYWGAVTNTENDEKKESNNDTIVRMLRQILTKEQHGDINPISDYSKHTLKSFISFVECNFQSYLKERLQSSGSKEIFGEFESFREKHSSIINEESWQVLEEFIQLLENINETANIKLKYRHSKTHHVTVLHPDPQEKSIFTISNYGSRIRMQFILKGKRLSQNYVDRSIALVESLNVPVIIKDKETGVVNILPEKHTSLSFETIKKAFMWRYELTLNE